MSNYAYTIRVGGPKSGQVEIQGRAIQFFEGVGPDSHTAPLHHAAMMKYLTDGSTSGTVTVEAE